MLLEVLPSTERIADLARKWMARHGVDGEVAPQQVVVQSRPKTYFRFTRLGVILFAAKRGDLDDVVAIVQAHRPETLSDEDNRARACGRDDLLDLVGFRIGRQVRVIGLTPMEQHIAHGSPYHI